MKAYCVRCLLTVEGARAGLEEMMPQIICTECGGQFPRDLPENLEQWEKTHRTLGGATSTQAGVASCADCRAKLYTNSATPDAALLCDACFAREGSRFFRGDPQIAKSGAVVATHSWYDTIMLELAAIRADIAKLSVAQRDNSDTTPEDAELYANKIARMIVSKKFAKAEDFLQSVFDRIEEFGIITRRQMRAIDRIEGSPKSVAAARLAEGRFHDQDLGWDDD